MCFVNCQLRRLEVTVLHVHAHVVIHSICQVIIIILKTDLCGQLGTD